MSRGIRNCVVVTKTAFSEHQCSISEGVRRSINGDVKSTGGVDRQINVVHNVVEFARTCRRQGPSDCFIGGESNKREAALYSRLTCARVSINFHDASGAPKIVKRLLRKAKINVKTLM